MLNAPVALLIFNRPHLTQRVFEQIAKAKPSRLLIVADGPREEIPGESEKCAQTRDIVEKVDWDCEVIKNYSQTNMGCKKRVSSGLDWVFETVECAIILEDDCLPHPSFFTFCDELLNYYRDSMRVMQICGSNFLNGWKRNNWSYYFSNYGPVWGWASWARAWNHNDVEMKSWPRVKKTEFYRDLFFNDEEAEWRLQLYDQVFDGQIDTWDYQWGFAKLINSGLSIVPNVNLISNIGFGSDATHTRSSENNPYANMKTEAISFPLRHSEFIVQDRLSDQKYVNDWVLQKGALASGSPKQSYLKKLIGKLISS